MTDNQDFTLAPSIFCEGGQCLTIMKFFPKLKALAEQLEILPVSFRDYQHLTTYHYVKYDIRPYLWIYGAYGIGQHRYRYPRPVAAIVFKPPMPSLKGRNQALKSMYPADKSVSVFMKWLNSNIAYAARFICDPRYEGQGITSWLAEQSFRLVPRPIIETLTTVNDNLHFLERVGLKQVFNIAPEYHTRLTSCFRKCHFSDQLLDYPFLAQRRIYQLTDSLRYELDLEMSRFCGHYKGRGAMLPGPERTAWILSKLRYPQAYHYLVKS